MEAAVLYHLEVVNEIIVIIQTLSLLSLFTHLIIIHS